MVSYFPPKTGVVTDPKNVKEILNYLKKIGYKGKIIIGDASSVKFQTSKWVFKQAGLYELKKYFPQIKIIDFKKYSRRKVNFQGRQLKNPYLPKGIMNWGIINVTRLKQHTLVGLSCGMKNLVGLLKEPIKIHGQHIHDCVGDVYDCLKRNIICTFVDGTRGMKNGQINGKTISPGLLIAGKDTVEVDKYCLDYFKMKIEDVGYLKRALKKT